MYLPSAEIAASVLSPVPVSLSSLSGGVTRALPSAVPSLAEFFLEPFDNSQNISPTPATTIRRATAIAIDRLLLLVEAAREAGTAPRFSSELTAWLSFGLVAGSGLSDTAGSG